MGGISYGQMRNILPAAGAGVTAHLTGTPTTTSLPLDVLLPDTADYAGGVVYLSGEYDGASAPPTFSTISSVATASGVSVLTVPALTATPLKGTAVYLYPAAKAWRQVSRASVSISASGDNTLIAAPGTGKTLHVVHFMLMNTSTSTAVTLILKDGATAMNGAGWGLPNTNGSVTFDAPGGPGGAELILSADSALVGNLSAAVQVSGWVLYYTA